MLRLKAYAKINLSLKILGKRPDGFHALESVMQSVSLFDVITLTPVSAGIHLTTNNLPACRFTRRGGQAWQLTTDNRNLAYQAAEVFLRTQNIGIKIHIEKNIPVAAGLAGGSADAAAVLFGLNQLTIINGQLSIKELMELGAQIGSDVPFCLVGGNCIVTGRGENVKCNPSNLTHYYVLVVPDLEVSTKWAYEEFDSVLANSPQLIVENSNHLEPVVIKKYPIIQKIEAKLLELGCTYAQMSGSGPAVFGEVKDTGQGEKICAEMKKEFSKSYLVHSVNQGIAYA